MSKISFFMIMISILLSTTLLTDAMEMKKKLFACFRMTELFGVDNVMQLYQQKVRKQAEDLLKSNNWDAQAGYNIAINLINDIESNDILEAFLERGLDPNLSSDCGFGSLLGTAIFSKNYNALKLLLEHEADPNTFPDGGIPLLSVLGDCKAAKILLKWKADPNRVCKVLNTTPLYEVLTRCSRNPNYIKRMAYLLISYGAGPYLAMVNKREEDSTAIAVARRKKFYDLVHFMETYAEKSPPLMTLCKRAIIKNKSCFNNDSFATLPGELKEALRIEELYDEQAQEEWARSQEVIESQMKKFADIDRQKLGYLP